jgi:putative oxidoreductase
MLPLLPFLTRFSAPIQLSAETVVPILTRFSFGQAFIFAGLDKLKDLDQTTSRFASLGVSMPREMGAMFGGLELLCGGLLVLGLFTRSAAAVLTLLMAAVILVARKVEFFHALQVNPSANLTELAPWMFGVGLLWLVAHGPGVLSLDPVVKQWWASRKARAAAAR